MVLFTCFLDANMQWMKHNEQLLICCYLLQLTELKLPEHSFRNTIDTILFLTLCAVYALFSLVFKSFKCSTLPSAIWVVSRTRQLYYLYGVLIVFYILICGILNLFKFKAFFVSMTFWVFIIVPQFLSLCRNIDPFTRTVSVTVSAPPKFTIVPMAMDRLMDRLGLELILSVNVNLMLTVTVTETGIETVCVNVPQIRLLRQ